MNVHVHVDVYNESVLPAIPTRVLFKGTVSRDFGLLKKLYLGPI